MASEAFENIIGIPAEDVRTLVRCAPRQYIADEWKDRILTWKDVKRGKDLFLKGCGTFDILKVYQDVISRFKQVFTRNVLDVIKVKRLHKTYKALHRGLPRCKMTVGELRTALSQAPELDLLELVSEALETDFNGLSHRPQSFVNWDGMKCSVDSSALTQTVSSGAINVYIEGTHNDPYYTQTSFWLLTVQELQVFGHFAQAVDCRDEYDEAFARSEFADLHSLLFGEDFPARRHVLKYHTFWNDGDNIGSIDELLVEWNDWNEEWDNMSPRQLLNALRERNRKKRMGENEQYHFLQSLPDSGNLKVLRSLYEIDDAARRLKNCAVSYATDVQEKECVLVLLEDDNGKAIALGLHPLGRGWRSNGWTEILGACNKRVSQQVRDKYYEYSRTLHV